MTMYWIYDIPNWQLAILTSAVFAAVSVVGFFATRPLTARILKSSPAHNDVVSYFLAAVGVLYGLALGLIAVGTWENFSTIDGLASKEAATLAELYRDFDGYPEAFRLSLEGKLRDYTRLVIETDWPAHRLGQAPEDGSLKLDEIEDQMLSFEPTRESERIAHGQALRSLDTVVEQRRLRLGSVDSGLPAALWGVMIAGAALNIALTYFFWLENVRLHAVLIAVLAISIALLVFLTVAMDNPFRGEFSVSSDAYKIVLDRVMNQPGGR